MELRVLVPEKRAKLLKMEDIKDKIKDIELELKDNTLILRGEDSIKVYKYSIVFKAFGRGFDLDTCLLLLKDDYTFDLISLESYSKSRNRQIVLKGRVIGKGGKIKKFIEERTNTKISMFGKTIGIIGKYYDVNKARRALEMLLEGAKHSTVIYFLEHEY